MLTEAWELAVDHSLAWTIVVHCVKALVDTHNEQVMRTVQRQLLTSQTSPEMRHDSAIVYVGSQRQGHKHVRGHTGAQFQGPSSPHEHMA